MKILFVCLGNICRSPMAEAVMRDKLSKLGLKHEVGSAGTSGWHVGEPPFHGTRRKLDAVSISYKGIKGRALAPADFTRFDYIIGLDRNNVADIKAMSGNKYNDKVFLLSDFVTDASWADVPDPWITGDFDLTYKLVNEGCDGILDSIKRLL